jgi:hypothetical protein
MASSEYYHRQADVCIRMALLTSIREERVRLLDRANEYRDQATHTESLPSESKAAIAETVRKGSVIE